MIASRIVNVPEGGTEIELPVTKDWGPGTYVTAILHRPMDVEAPDEIRPRQVLPVTLSIGNLEPGKKALVTLATVDVGILNLTDYQTPKPDDWLFGQRALGIEIRDLYSRLIDRSPDELVSFHSGIVEIGADGAATI